MRTESDSVTALLARAGDQWFAMALSRLRRVLPAPKLYPLPGAGLEIAGLAEIDGEPLVILSLERLLEAPAGAGSEIPVALLVSPTDRPADVVGLLADEAGEIVTIRPEKLAGPPAGLVLGSIEIGDKLVKMLDLTMLGGGV